MSAAADTSPVREGQAFDEVRLATYLRERLPEIESPITVRQFKGGQSNPTFLIEGGACRYVLRKKPPGELLPSAHQIEREYKVMHALAGTTLPVAPVRLLCEDPTVIGTNFYVMDLVEGRVFRDPTLPGLSPADRREIYDAMSATLATLHGVDWAAAGLSDFGKPTGYIARQIKTWTRQFLATRTHDIPSMDRLMGWLPENIPSDDRATIAHGDFRLENLIFAPDRPCVLAVFDWELATLGHPLTDLSYNCMSYHLPAEWPALGGLKGVDLESLGIPTEDAYVGAYCRRTGRSAIENWPFYLAFSLFRCAAILQGVRARAESKTASSADGLTVGLLAAPVADIAWQQAQRLD